MTSLREEIELDVPAERVWAVIHEDVENAPRWSAHLTRVEVLGPGRGKGAKIRYHLKLPGGINERLEVEQTTFTPPKKCAGRFVGGPLKGTWSYTYKESGGRTRLVYEMEYQMGGLLRFTAGLMAGEYAKGIRQNFADLKRYVETGKGIHE